MCVALKVARKWMTPRISLGSASSVIVDSEEGFCALVQANDLWVGSGEFLEPGWKSEVVRKVIRGSSLKVENVRGDGREAMGGLVCKLRMLWKRDLFCA